MLGLALGQHIEEFVMTGATIFRWNVISIHDVQRAVRLMAAQAILIGHEGGMRLVAFKALLNLFMLLGMTEGAVHCGVLAGEFCKLIALFRVTSLAAEADLRYVANGYVEGSMWITVASQAIRELEVTLAVGIMAHGALGDSFCAQGEMFEVTVQAGDFGLMFAPVPFDVSRFTVVAFHAIGIL